jgi:transcriptional regulator with GAF, ATPase, and Fis domain
MRNLFAVLEKVAPTELTVLLEGESGTGKELFARTLHAYSPRADGPFVPINCAAIPENLLETELFGYEKGAFTGAANRKPGKFELAHRGTLFLDEIGELPLALQAKILRALEEKRFERVGGLAAIQVDVRVVAATNRNLKAAVAARQYGEDLYFRLSVFPITIPPLRDRANDIPMLATFFVDRFCRDENKRPLALAPSAIEALVAHQWRGNVRELQNCIERAVILTEGDAIHARHLNLPSAVANAPDVEPGDPWAAIDLSGSLADVTRRITAEAEKRKITQVLNDSGGDVGRASEILQVPFKALNARLRHYKLEER